MCTNGDVPILGAICDGSTGRCVTATPTPTPTPTFTPLPDPRCKYNTAFESQLVPGRRKNPAFDKSGCQLEWYVARAAPCGNSGPTTLCCGSNDPQCNIGTFDTHGDPCGETTKDGPCYFQVVACLNNDDPKNLPQCKANGVESLKGARVRVHLRPQQISKIGPDIRDRDKCEIVKHLQLLHDPQQPQQTPCPPPQHDSCLAPTPNPDPASEADGCYGNPRNMDSLSSNQKGFCSRPFPVEVPFGATAVISVTTRSGPAISPQRTNTSRLNLFCGS